MSPSPSDLATLYDVQIEVRSPLHIGAGKGEVLKRGFDFVTQYGMTYRLNTEALLEAYWPEDPAQQRSLLSGMPGDLVERVDLRQHPELVSYAYRGQPQLGEIFEHIKDVNGQAYLPGSSLKGALRTALLRTLIEGVKQHRYTRNDIGPAMQHPRDARAAVRAGEKLERNFAIGHNTRGPATDSNYSLFRALQVADSVAAPADALALVNVQLRPGLVISVEAVRTDTKLHATAKLDRYLLRSQAERLGFDPQAVSTLRDFTRAAQFTAGIRIQQELLHHLSRNEEGPSRFYALLYKESQEIVQGNDKATFFAQIGFATGWRSKTLLGGLTDNDPLLAQIVNEFQLDRGGKMQGKRLRDGNTFPASRHLAMQSDKPALPMGWIKVTAQRI